MLIQMIGPMGDCGIADQRAKIKKINPVSKIGSLTRTSREAWRVDIYNWKRS
ncbi:hypothetical protein HDF09_001908 [Edaphobacter lichenicola]|uniref:Uncharacterized protein n=1 Tax=Tunturiibacter empetritectus TaxID=3069691 RepID=A0A7W8IHH7_9BACT|nr:hypothetical protein [Edaphobacter lichenicola]